MIVVPIVFLLLIAVLMLSSGGARADGDDMVTYQGDHGLDLNGNGTYEYLVVEVSIKVPTTGPHFIYGELRDQSDRWIGNARCNVYFDTIDPKTAALSFSGGNILEKGMNGPFTVIVTVKDQWDGVMGKSTFTTNGYEHSQFEAAASFHYVGEHAEDTDGNGAFDEIMVDIDLDVYIAEDYWLDVVLMDSTYRLIDSNATSGGHNIPGSYQVNISLDCGLVADYGVDGPYHLNITLWKYLTPLDNRTFETAAYDADDFDQEALIQGPIAERVIDSDLDGKGEYLYLDFNVTASKDGLYGVEQ